MNAVRVSVHVAENVELDDHLNADAGREPSGCLYLGAASEVALWGLPAALRRLAAALVLVAERAEDLRDLRDATTGNGRVTEGGLRAVVGS